MDGRVRNFGFEMEELVEVSDADADADAEMPGAEVETGGGLVEEDGVETEAKERLTAAMAAALRAEV